MTYIRQQFVRMVVVLLVVTFLTFYLVNLLPGGPEIAILGPGANEEQVAEVRADLRLDDPIPLRYARWLGDAVQFDFGESYVNDVPVTELLRDRLPVTMQLMTYATILALAVALPMGVLAAYRANGWFDRASNATAFGLIALPNFILAVLLIYLFALQLGWFPATGSVPFGEDPFEHFKSMFLPALSLAAGQLAVYMRLLRTDMIATLQEDYIGVAKAKGMPTRRILVRHAFRPSLFSLLTVVAINIGALIGGSVIIETIFALNGLGRQLVVAIGQRDYLVVQATVVIIAVTFVVANFLVDALYAVLDPRIRHARAVA